MQTTIDREISALTDHAEQIKNDDLRVFGGEWSAGDVAAQGDVLLVAIKSVPKGSKPRLLRQVADGDTQGSRHILAPGCKIYDSEPAAVAKAIEAATTCKVAERYIGPVFRTPALLTHPEHGDLQWTETGVVACVFQRVLDAEQREQRVVD